MGQMRVLCVRVIRTGFYSPPNTVILIVGCAVPSHIGGYRDAERIFGVTNVCVLLGVGGGPEDFCVVDEGICVERVDPAQTGLVATDADCDRLCGDKFPVVCSYANGWWDV